jgi:hypothetical protein
MAVTSDDQCRQTGALSSAIIHTIVPKYRMKRELSTSLVYDI